jgi:hypothetical protein
MCRWERAIVSGYNIRIFLCIPGRGGFQTRPYRGHPHEAKKESRMKEKDVRIDYKKHQLILYVEKKDGSYGPVRTGSYITKNYLDDFWFKRKNLEKEYLEKVKTGEISSIAYYMTMEELTLSELASRVNMPERRVKKHLDPRNFGKLSVEELNRYCEVFNVPFAGMFHLIVADRGGIKIREEKTGSPFFSVLTVEAGKK